jgi:hypothetical protein
VIDGAVSDDTGYPHPASRVRASRVSITTVAESACVSGSADMLLRITDATATLGRDWFKLARSANGSAIEAQVKRESGDNRRHQSRMGDARCAHAAYAETGRDGRRRRAAQRERFTASRASLPDSPG